ncbi:hypothetical protein K3495_g11855 [Podosphaera aphanis]|nr:hypothetical protein K3495_g11855 [Podosphaera aphanis]
MSKTTRLEILLQQSVRNYSVQKRPKTPYSLRKGSPKKPPRCSSFSHHWNTVPPTPYQLMKAAEFFQRASTEFLWSKENFKDMPFGKDFGESPEVCFLGRSNVGKSSLLNTLLCKRLAYTSSKPGRTKLMSAFAVKGSTGGDMNRLIVIDLPGYGKGGRAEWGQQIIKYLENRRQFKRAFLLIDAEHGLKKTDIQMLELLEQIGASYQVILSKADKILPANIETTSNSGRLQQVINEIKQTLCMEIQNQGPAVGEIIPCSSTKWLLGRRFGINELRFAVLRAADMEYRDTKPAVNPAEIITYDELFPSQSDNLRSSWGESEDQGEREENFLENVYDSDVFPYEMMPQTNYFKKYRRRGFEAATKS